MRLRVISFLVLAGSAMKATVLIAGSCALYLAVVRIVRYRRRDKLLAQFPTSEAVENMTPIMAQKILQGSLLYEHPMVYHLGTQVALLKVYGIASVASLLIKTGQLNTYDLISKRMADTILLIATWITNPLTGRGSGNDNEEDLNDPRGALAVARVNYLHGKHLIKNDDLLYNLALFIIEPSRWIEILDWRPHTPVERQALFVFWREIGRRMGIKDLWDTYGDMYDWAMVYEQKRMKPSQASNDLVTTLMNHFSKQLPPIPGARWLLRNVALSLLEERARRAMMLEDPSPTVKRLVYCAFRIRALIVRHMCLPRRQPSHWVEVEPAWPDGRMQAVYKLRAGPWYHREATGMQKLLQDAMVALGLISPRFIPGRKWKSEGYRLEEMGPVKFENVGHREVMEKAERLHGQVIGAPYSLESR